MKNQFFEKDKYQTIGLAYLIIAIYGTLHFLQFGVNLILVILTNKQQLLIQPIEIAAVTLTGYLLLYTFKVAIQTIKTKKYNKGITYVIYLFCLVKLLEGTIRSTLAAVVIILLLHSSFDLAKTLQGK